MSLLCSFKATMLSFEYKDNCHSQSNMILYIRLSETGITLIPLSLSALLLELMAF